jgi:D-2-hydroxyacid dehydrogenase (NADP+)
LRVVIGIELEPEQTKRIRDSFPHLEVVEAPDKDSLLEAIPSATILLGGKHHAEFLPLAHDLRWIQTYSAGINFLPLSELSSRGIQLTNASGAHGVQITENVLSMMLAFAVRLPDLIRAQENGAWIASQIDKDKFSLDGQTLLIIGLGGIGAALAEKASALGLHVIGIRNRPLPPPAGVAELASPDDLHSCLAKSDHVALCLPLTSDTTNYIGESELRAMKSTAYVYNVGRGKSINQKALVGALSEGWIAGAGLDVTDPEPLPSDDPLWKLRNVILTQHTSGGIPDLDRRVTDIFIENLRRFANNEPLKNLIDLDRQY